MFYVLNDKCMRRKKNMFIIKKTYDIISMLKNLTVFQNIEKLIFVIVSKLSAFESLKTYLFYLDFVPNSMFINTL